jgi:Tfp pilus assembly protein PilX
MRKEAKHPNSAGQRGVAMLFTLFTLLLLSAIAATLVFLTNTETAVNSNYRAERVTSFAAKAGMEEVRDRMPTLNAANLLPGQVNGVTTPFGVFPPAANSVLYIINSGAGAQSTVQPWVASTSSSPNPYMDDELCHDFAGVQQVQATSDVRCTTPPTATMAMPSQASTYPWNGTAAALPYKWVRVTLKQSGSVSGYPVNGAAPTTQVCWNGSTEVLLNALDGLCKDNTAPGVLPPTVQSTNPVYVITALAASSTGTTRKMVQAEVALSPAQPFPYGLFATGTSCPSLSFVGGGNNPIVTGSYNSANGGTPVVNTGGDVGTNGGVNLTGQVQVGGAIGVPSLNPAPPSCGYPTVANTISGGDISTSGGAGVYNPGAGPGNPGQFPGNVPTTAGPFTFPTPPDPTPLPTASGPVPATACPKPAKNSTCAVPGNYGTISLSGQNTLVLAPGVYNIYSLSLSGQSSITSTGPVVLNFPSGSQNPISISGQGVQSSSNIPNDFQINYGGTGTVQLSGNGSSYAVVDAPNAALTVSGNGVFYGRVVGKTISYSGNAKFYFDKNTALGPQSNGGYHVISMREITY